MKIPDPCGSLTVKDQIKEEHKMPFEIDNMLEETPQTIKVVGVGGGGGNAVAGTLAGKVLNVIVNGY